MSKVTRRSIATVFIMVVLLLSTNAGASETIARQGFYFGADVGASIADTLNFGRINRGIGTNCDQWLNSDTLTNAEGQTFTVPLPLDQCSPRDYPKATSNFELGPGLLAGVNLGYAIDNVRIEFEYFRRQQSGDSHNVYVPADNKTVEFSSRQQQVDSLRADNFFANVYYDLHNMISPRLTPYLGGGLGFMRISLDYTGTTIRKSAETLRGLGRNPDAADRHSVASALLSDTLFGYQLLAGLDYAMSQRFSVGVKVRYADTFSNFDGGEYPWNPLRGHESTVGPPGTPGYNTPILYRTDADTLSFWGISLNLKYFFDM